jgi:type 2 lantibiotic biosynthesis protein LanM
VERAVARQAPDGVVPGTLPADWRDALAVPLWPLVVDTTDLVRTRAADVLGTREADLGPVVASFARWLGRRLMAIAVRTFVSRLHELRTDGLLHGADPTARFADFVNGLARPGELAALLARYPVLARLLGETCDAAGAAMLELLTRFAADRPAIVAELLDGADPGRLVSVRPGLGDPHQRGRSVATLRFADGTVVVYRPRDVRTYGRVAAAVARLNEVVPDLGLRTVRVVTRAGYGWLEHIPHRPMTEPGQVDRFYRRQGALLALLYVLDATDMHCGNLVACEDQPVLVDVETLFHPQLPMSEVRAADPAVRAWAASVHRTALLPVFVAGDLGVMDVSALGGGTAERSPGTVVDWDFAGTDRMRLVRRGVPLPGGQNQPLLAGHEAGRVDSGAHEPALREGFRLGYDAIRARRAEFAEHIAGYADLDVRVVVRPTQGYATLLDESTHPALLRDAADRDGALAVFGPGSADDPLRAGLATHELADLWAGDVPLFHTRPGSRDLWTAEGVRLPDRLGTTGVHRALRKLGDMCEADRRDQEWIIAATLATRGNGHAPHAAPGPVPGPLTGAIVHPRRLLTAACAIADRIVASGPTADGRVNWLGLELVDDRQWAVLPMGGGLADGYLGVALFLAELARVSGVTRYADTARAAIAPVPRLLDVLAGNPDLVALVGAGGLRGLGGVAYGLSRLTTLLGDPGLGTWTRTAVDLAAAAPHRPGWADGSAGCLAAMRAVHAEHGLPEAARLAAACADHTAEVALGPGESLPAGFADGWAGIAWALARCVPGAGPRHLTAARTALGHVTEGTAEPGWCRGAAGELIARLGVGDADPDAARAALAERPVLHDLSLCHGELGVAEALAVLAAAAPGEETAFAVRRRAGAVLAAIDRHGLPCGTPGRVPTPGLLNGLAGMGHGLLRLGFPQQVPSVLLLGSELVSGR